MTNKLTASQVEYKHRTERECIEEDNGTLCLSFPKGKIRGEELEALKNGANKFDQGVCRDSLGFENEGWIKRVKGFGSCKQYRESHSNPPTENRKKGHQINSQKEEEEERLSVRAITTNVREKNCGPNALKDFKGPLTEIELRQLADTKGATIILANGQRLEGEILFVRNPALAKEVGKKGFSGSYKDGGIRQATDKNGTLFYILTSSQLRIWGWAYRS